MMFLLDEPLDELVARASVLRDAGQKVITGADGAAADARLADTAAGPLRDMFSWCDAHDFIGAS